LFLDSTSLGGMLGGVLGGPEGPIGFGIV
jgi:hypothetical protein